jgi:peptidoglycan/xylan/chitin deacetylase (PgdA/CDA1 family)
MYRRLASHLLHLTGAVSLWLGPNKSSVCFLTLHSVLDETKEWTWLPLRSYVDADSFATNLVFLKQYMNFVSMETAIEILRGESEPVPNAVVLTFDDGYLNHFDTALPIMESLEIPGIFFVVSSMVGAQTPFWFDRLDYALQHNVSDMCQIDCLGSIQQVDGSNVLRLREDMIKLFRRIESESKNDLDIALLAQPVIEQVESIKGCSLLSHYADGTHPCTIASPEVVRAAAASKYVSIGSHTSDHVRLTHIDGGEIENQLSSSFECISARTGKPPKVFCYPSGNYDCRAVAIVRDSPYEVAFTSDEGLNCVGSDLLRMHRTNWPPGAGPVEILAVASGAYSQS